MPCSRCRDCHGHAAEVVMKRSAYLLALVSMVSWSFAEDDSQVDAVLNRYFERYCDYTGNMGIGFVPSHTYDFAFRQHLKQTQDRELKRLFTLQRLSRDAEIAVDDFRKGVIDLGKGYTRPMTEEERALAKER